MTIVEMLDRNAEEIPEKTAIICNEQKLTWKEFAQKANSLGNFLLDIGFERGDRVGLMIEKSPEAVISFLGGAKAGGIVLPIDFNLTVESIQSILNQTVPRVLIVNDKFQDLLEKLNLPETEMIVIGNTNVERYHTWSDAMSKNQEKGPAIDIHENDVVYLNYTSGTTGMPKGAVTTHANIYWNTLSAVEILEMTADDVHLCMFPVFAHPHELFARPLYLGGTLVLVDSISPKTIFKAIVDNGVTCMMAVASIYMSLVRFNESRSIPFDSLRLAESGGMHFDPTLAIEFEKCFNIPIMPVWGSTETGGIALSNSINGIRKKGSMGQPCPYYDVKIVDEDGRELGPDQTGELAVRGAAVCSEYYGNDEETRKHMKEGWFFSGDLVRKDAEGYYYFVSRKTGMMKVAGLKVSPLEIEEILYTHSSITEVAVVKAHDSTHGEVPKAVVVVKEGAELGKPEVRKFCEKRMARYKVPRIIEFRDELPKTPGGKIWYRKI